MKLEGLQELWLFLLLFLGVKESRSQFPQPGRVCPQGWLYVNDQCWKYEMQPTDWQNARGQCQAQGSDMASIHSEEENRFIYSMILKYGSNFGRPGPILFDNRRFGKKKLSYIWGDSEWKKIVKILLLVPEPNVQKKYFSIIYPFLAHFFSHF